MEFRIVSYITIWGGLYTDQTTHINYKVDTNYKHYQELMLYSFAASCSAYKRDNAFCCYYIKQPI